MEIRKKLVFDTANGPKERECIFFTVKYNHFRDVSTSTALECRDREEMAECECVLCLPDTYTDSGEETPLVFAFHGAGGRVCAADDKTGGVYFMQHAADAGYAVMDVCGSEKHGTTLGCPEHLLAAYKAYRYVVKRYNVSDRLLLAGSSMGGQCAMNFANTFPSSVTAVGIFCPRLHMDGVEVDGHYCIGTWDKTEAKNGIPASRDLIKQMYHIQGDTWDDTNTVGFNPHRTRSFVNADGERVTMPPCPVKIWQGTADATVDPLMVQEYVRSVKRAGCYIELRLLEGVGHTIHPVMEQEIVMWFNRFTDC